MKFGLNLVLVWEKEMATHSSIRAERIPWTEKPGGLLSMGSYRVGHDWSDLACIHALEKEMATHSSILPWGIPGTEAPGGLQSIGLHRVGHDWSDLACMHAWSLSSEEPKCEDITRSHMGMVCLCLRRKDSAGDYGSAPFVLSLCLLRKIMTRGRCKRHPQVRFQHLAPPHWSVLNDVNSLRL